MANSKKILYDHTHVSYKKQELRKLRPALSTSTLKIKNIVTWSSPERLKVGFFAQRLNGLRVKILI